MPVIEIEGLRKEYRTLRGGATVAVDDLDLTVPEGGVFGFLGPNGSGKTTTIRALLGLVRPSAGRCAVLGADPQRDLASVIARVGSIVEAPAPFLGFSAKRNLTLLARTAGVPLARVDDALERVGLQERAREQVRRYSLGMKQRLAIAMALLKEPDLLILDEPANGLDPAGIKEVRDLLRRLGAEGKTVFVSSHLLSEVQAMCDRVAILSKGRCVASGPVGEVLSMRRASALRVRVPDPAAASAALADAGLPARHEGDALLVDLPAAEGGRVTEALAARGIYLSELRPVEASLEDVFLELTEGLPATGVGP